MSRNTPLPSPFRQPKSEEEAVMIKPWEQRPSIRAHSFVAGLGQIATVA